MDEFNRFPEEFHRPPEEYKIGSEFNEKLKIDIAPKSDFTERKQKTKKIMKQYLTTLVVSVAVVTNVVGQPVAAEPEPEPEPIIVTITCSECNGTGIHCEGAPDFGYDRGNGTGYAGCGGTGYSACPDNRCVDGTVPCPGCSGTGIQPHGAVCEFCGGSGRTICEFCNGTGIAPCISADSHAICVKCNGTGEIKILK